MNLHLNFLGTNGFSQTLSRMTRAGLGALLTLAATLFHASAHAQAVSIQAGSVDIAQTHVLNADGAFGPNGGVQPRIIGNRDTLLKVNFVASQSGVAASRLSAWLTLFNAQNQKTSILLSPPTTVTTFPTTFDISPATVVHSFSNSYTAVIPAQWVKPGLTWELNWVVFNETGGVSSTQLIRSGPLYVGPPHQFITTLIDVQWFTRVSTFKDMGILFDEMRQKMPVSGIEVRRSMNNFFPKVAMPRTGNFLPVILENAADLVARGGGGVTRSNHWASVLQKAAGRNYYEVSDFGVINQNLNGGLGSDGYFFSSQAGIGVFWHELGHSFMFRHWGNSNSYPYKDPDNDGPAAYTTYLGLSTGSQYRNAHVGPYWAYDGRVAGGRAGTFVAPWVDSNADGNPDRWKGTPMQGGGTVDAAPGFMLAHLSDFEINQMNSRLDDKAVWFSADNEWIADADWAARGAGWFYSSSNGYVPFAGNGSGRPIGPDRDVYSIMVAGSMASNGGAQPFKLIYPPIGPYKSNVRTLYDPRTQKTELAQAGVCPAGGCDLALEVTQGGVVRVYALEVNWDTSKPYTDASTFFEVAINVPANLGEITSIKIFEAPDQQDNGFPAVPLPPIVLIPPPIVPIPIPGGPNPQENQEDPELVLTLSPSTTPVRIEKNSAYVIPNATCTEDDVDISSSISITPTTVNTSQVGTKYQTFKCTGSDGNFIEKTVEIEVHEIPSVYSLSEDDILEIDGLSTSVALPNQFVCPPTMVVAGIGVYSANTQNIKSVNGVKFLCAPLNKDGSIGSAIDQATAGYPAIFGWDKIGTTSLPFTNLACTSKIVNGIQVTYGSWMDSLSIYCATASEVLAGSTIAPSAPVGGVAGSSLASIGCGTGYALTGAYVYAYPYGTTFTISNIDPICTRVLYGPQGPVVEPGSYNTNDPAVGGVCPL